jgi:putative hemolysin
VTRLLTEGAIILALLLLNGILAMSELAVVAARRSRLERLAARDAPGARAALALASNPTRFLSTVQLGITLIGILAGAVGGATIARELAGVLATVPWIGQWAEELAFALVVAGITFLSLIIGELVPKRVALANPERIASAVSRPMTALSRAGHPLISLLGAVTDGVIRVVRLGRPTEPAVTDEDVRALVAQGRASGEIHAVEQEILDRALRLGETTAASVMTPRTDIDWVPAGEPPERLRPRLRAHPHRYVVVADGTVDQVIGVARTEDLLGQLLEGRPLDLAAVLRPPLYIPETATLARLLEMFRQGGRRIAIVLDEFGGVAGLVTLTDVLEALVGDLAPAAPGEEPDLVRRPDGSVLVDGGVAVAELARAFGVEELVPDHRGEFLTVAGLVLTLLGRIPQVGEAVESGGFRYEVVDLDGRRIDRVLASRVEVRGEK